MEHLGLVTPNSSLLGRAPVPNTTLTWPFVNATAAGARARCACACGAACGVEGSCSCCESLCAAAARTRRLLDTPPPRLALFDASRGAWPLPPLAPVDMGFLTNSVPIAGPLIDKMTSPPWVFVSRAPTQRNAMPTLAPHVPKLSMGHGLHQAAR